MGMYFDELTRSMDWLAEMDDTVFVGQAVAVPGTAMFNTLSGVPIGKRIELPVAEEMQMGMATGMAMNREVPVCIFPRWNFLLLAVNQLINHLDRMAQLSNQQYETKVIIRTSIGSERPLHPQFQHVGDFTESFRGLLKNIDVVRLDQAVEIFPAYEHAYQREDGRSTLLVEYGDFYQEK